jgi:hypothetical protein
MEQCGSATEAGVQGLLEMNFSNKARPNCVPHFVWLRRECPRCNSLKFKPAELGSFDSLLAICSAAGSLRVLLAPLICVPRQSVQ